MRTLYLMRHAKSSWDDDSLDDHDRPLNERGRDAAPAVAAYMREHEMVPELVLCSSSARTRETWALAGPIAAPDARVEISEDFYLASAGEWLGAINDLDTDEDPVLILGHNPGMHVLARTLVGDGGSVPMRELAMKYPTGALAVIRFTVDSWRDVIPGAGYLMDFVRPRTLSD